MISTTIYMLVDTRPETVAAGYTKGRPVHVGTSKYSCPTDISDQIKIASSRGKPWQSIAILESLGDHFRIDMIGDRHISVQWVRAMFPPRADRVNKRRKRYEPISASELDLIRRYLPSFK